MQEIWKEIEGFDGDYQISNFGKIKSLKFNKEKILSQVKDGHRYLHINLYKNGNKKPKYIHDLMFESFNNYKLEKNEVVHHIDKNPENNDLDNFKLMINSEHMSLHKSGKNSPMFEKHHSEKTLEIMREKKIGENNPSTTLKNGEVWLIKKILNPNLYKSKKITQNFIGKMFNVNRRTISAIKTGRFWSHI